MLTSVQSSVKSFATQVIPCLKISDGYKWQVIESDKRNAVFLMLVGLMLSLLSFHIDATSVVPAI